MADGLLAVVFPTPCVLCDRELPGSWSGICGGCWTSLDPWNGAACARCGLPFASDAPFAADAGDSASVMPSLLCSSCRTEEYDFDLARSYGLYRGILRAAILQLKFHGYERMGGRLGALLALLWRGLEDAVVVESEEAPLIVPVPLHRSRRRERGFNQAELLARGLAGALTDRASPAGRATPRLESRGLYRNRATAPQTGLSLSVRQGNVRGAFVVDSPERFRERAVILVDDVMTTGATASACAAALKRAGARQVVVLTLARVSPQFPDLDAAQPV